MKVYCIDCKYCNCYGCPKCYHPNNIIEYDTWFGKQQDLKEQPFIKNENNDCKDFEPHLFYRIKNFILKIFKGK